MSTLFLTVNALSLLCALTAAVLAIRGRDTWGWFLFVAFLTFSGTQALTRFNEANRNTVVASDSAAAGMKDH